MRISDWSSDVCSSDLRIPGGIYPTTENAMEKFGFHDYGFDGAEVGLTWEGYKFDIAVAGDAARAIFDYARSDKAGRSEEHTYIMPALMHLWIAVLRSKNKIDQRATTCTCKHKKLTIIIMLH